MIYRNEKKKSPRITVLCVLLAACIAIFGGAVARLHIYSSNYVSTSNSTSVRNLVINASRGQIVDRNGKPLAYNTDGYSVIFDRAYLETSRVNNVIIELSKLLMQNGEEWIDLLPISENEPYEFITENEKGESNEDMVSALIKVLELNHYATAQNCVDEMIQRYKLEEYTSYQKRLIMGVRFSMEYLDYSTAVPFTFSESVGERTMTVIKENKTLFKGVDIEVTSQRSYDVGNTAANIVGTSGPVYAEEWEKLKDLGYSYDDITGKSGIEIAAESYLHGTNGVRKITQDVYGNVISNEITQAAVNGDTVMLTIDKDLQDFAYKSLESRIKYLQSHSAPEANAGSVVVIHNASNAVLAAVNYPSYDMETYVNDYESLLVAEGKPLFNRAFMGTYEPGSTFKPATALAGLQSGAITSTEYIDCTKKYKYYDDFQPSCLSRHGPLDVKNAITYSCNYFFFEVGRRTGILSLNKFCQTFGLGVKTGVEIEESAGILAGPDYREKLNAVWNPGDTIQAAIGQSDNLFTPLQMAVYASSIVNNGTRYKAHLIDSVYTYDLSQTVMETKPEVVATSGIEQKHYNNVKQGMHSVATDGTVSSVFRNFKIEIGGKTGTAQVLVNGEMKNNALFISYAPFENPEISVIVVIERGGYGSHVAQVAKEIYNYYFSYHGETYVAPNANVLM